LQLHCRVCLTKTNLVIYFYTYLIIYVWLDSLVDRRWTSNREITSSSLTTALGKLPTHMNLCHHTLGIVQKEVMLCSWDCNRRHYGAI